MAAAAKRERSSEEQKKILEEARERFNRCKDWESTARARFDMDIKFDAGDAYNNYQWDVTVLGTRNGRPSMTVNRVRQHNLDILNDARQSKVAVKVRPLRGGASYESAMILDGIIRHIEYISNAESAYQTALGFAVRGGIGYFRLATAYSGDDTFDQEIFIRRVKDPRSIYLDPDISEFDGSDAKFGFVFTDVPNKEFEKSYPKYKGDAGRNSELSPTETWCGVEKTRVAEYFRCVEDEDQLIAYIDPEKQQQVTKRKSELAAELLAQVVDAPGTAERTVKFTKVEHFKIIGDRIAEEKVWPGKYIPILRTVGEETIIDGQLDRKGHTRSLIDSQRYLNYNISGAAEYGALQTKSPWVAPAKAIEGYEDEWNTANIVNRSVLPYHDRDDDGNEIQKPERPQPPSSAPVFMQGSRDAIEWMYLASGQNPSDFGQPGNEKSGVAIEARQRQGDNATYHYLDHQASTIRFAGKQLLDLIGKVYDTKRIVKWRDDAGNEGEVTIDPDATEHFQQEENPDGTKTAILNPKMGTYDVQADVGPAYATRRQEAFAAFSQLLGANKELVGVVGDIWMRFADVPGAEEAAERMKRMIPEQALKDGPNPDVIKLQQKIQGMTQLIGELNEKLADKSGDLAVKVEKNQIEQERNAVTGYDSVTKRVAALKEALALDPDRLMMLVREVLEEGITTSGDGSLSPALAVPATEDISPALGGQLQPPAPHTPPLDPNKAMEPAETA